MGAIAFQDVAEFRQPHVAVLFDQLHELQPAAAIASTARDLEHRDPAGEIAERDHVASHGPTGRSSARDTRQTRPAMSISA
jgi:hypothetical protein